DVFMPARPGSIEAAYLRQLTGSSPTSFPVDYPLCRIGSREEWSAVSLKTMGSWPSAFFYDPVIPNGQVFIWPIPIQVYFELHFMVPQDIRSILPTMDLDTLLPPEADEAIIYNLAMRLRLNYQLPPDPGLA